MTPSVQLQDLSQNLLDNPHSGETPDAQPPILMQNLLALPEFQAGLRAMDGHKERPPLKINIDLRTSVEIAKERRERLNKMKNKCIDAACTFFGFACMVGGMYGFLRAIDAV